jgi:hypothetical protein
MAGEGLTRRPARGTLGNVETGETLSFQFNPDELDEELGVDFGRLAPLGYSHKPLQFKGTDNRTMAFELFFDAMSEGGGVKRINAWRRFLLSLCYPTKSAGDVASGGPPRAIFVWPGLGSFTGRITKVKFKHKRFNQALKPTQTIAQVTIEEIRDTRIYSEDVRGTTPL